MAEISLTKGKKVLVDDEDYEKLSQNKWYAVQGKYAARDVRINGKRHHIRMHRLIMGAKEGDYVDHINGDTLDNRKENLRIVTNLQNSLNRGKQVNNKSGYKGVNWHKAAEKWCAEIKYNGKKHYLGLFEEVEEAARAYNEKAIELHGEFANLNEI